MPPAKDGIDIRVTDETMVFASQLKTPAGALLTTGTTSVYLYEIQCDGTLKSYDFSDNTFKTTSLATETLAGTHQKGNNGTTDTGNWTATLATLTGFTVGARYIVAFSNAGSADLFVERQFIYGAAILVGDLRPMSATDQRKRSQACVIYISLYDFTTDDLLSSPTIAAGDFRISKDGGAMADLATLPTVTPAGSGFVKITLSAAEMNAGAINISCVDQTVPDEWKARTVTIVTSAVDIDDVVRAATPANLLNVNAGGNAGLDFATVSTPTTPLVLTNIEIPTVTSVTTVQAIAADAINAAAIAADAIGSSELADTAVQKIWDALTTNLTTAGSIGKKLVDDLDSIIAQIGGFSGVDDNTVKGYLLAMVLHSATLPTDMAGFAGSTSALSKIGPKTEEIGSVGGSDLGALLTQVDTNLTAATAAARIAAVDLTIDDANSKDEFTVTLFENGAIKKTGWSAVQIQVIKRADGSDLIAKTAMAKIGGNDYLWTYDATGVERVTAGEAVVVIVSGTVDGDSFESPTIKGRDSA